MFTNLVMNCSILIYRQLFVYSKESEVDFFLQLSGLHTYKKQQRGGLV